MVSDLSTGPRRDRIITWWIFNHFDLQLLILCLQRCQVSCLTMRHTQRQLRWFWIFLILTAVLHWLYWQHPPGVKSFVKGLEMFSQFLVLSCCLWQQQGLSVSTHYPNIPATYLCSVTIMARGPSASLFTTSIQRELKRSFKYLILQIYLRTFCYYFSPPLR